MKRTKEKDFWFFKLPNGKGYDEKSDEVVKYPCIVFDDVHKSQEIFAFLNAEGPKWIFNRIKDLNPELEWPRERLEKKKKGEKKPKEVKQENVSKEPEKISFAIDIKEVTKAYVAKKKPIDMTKWQDPPKKKS